MGRLSWDDVGQRFFETGVDRGVLFVDNDGVPWNGLVTVSQKISGGSITPYFIDGEKYAQVSSPEQFEGTIEAYTSPPEFDECDGIGSIGNGLRVFRQPRKSFGLSWRTIKGNDVNDIANGYKIHILYNALAAPTNRSYSTLKNSIDPTMLSWDVQSKPTPVCGQNWRSTSYFVVDSTETPQYILDALENILYGHDGIQTFNVLNDITATEYWQYNIDAAVVPGNPEAQFFLANASGRGSVVTKDSAQMDGTTVYFSVEGSGADGFSVMFVDGPNQCGYAGGLINGNVLNPIGLLFDSANGNLRAINHSNGQSGDIVVASGQNFNFSSEYSIEFAKVGETKLQAHIWKTTGPGLDVTFEFPGTVDNTINKYLGFGAASGTGVSDPRQIGWIEVGRWSTGDLPGYSYLPTVCELIEMFGVING